MKEIAVGQIFKYNNKFYKTEEKVGCNCAFKAKNMDGTTYCSAEKPLIPCMANYRQDKKNVVHTQIIPHINMPYLDINDMLNKIYNGENNNTNNVNDMNENVECAKKSTLIETQTVLDKLLEYDNYIQKLSVIKHLKNDIEKQLPIINIDKITVNYTTNDKKVINLDNSIFSEQNLFDIYNFILHKLNERHDELEKTIINKLNDKNG
jgi:hypothetical protein